jgi:replicative DNA helicase
MTAPTLPTRDVHGERMVLGAFIQRPELLAPFIELEVGDFFDLRSRVVFGAIRALEAGGHPIAFASVEAEIARQEKLDAVASFLTAIRRGTPAIADDVLEHARARLERAVAEIVGRSIATTDAIEGAEARLRAEHEVDELALRDAEPHQPPDDVAPFTPSLPLERRAPQPPSLEPPEATRRGRDVAKCGAEIIAEIDERKSEPFVPLLLGPDTLVEPWLGAIVLINGGTGAGKTSLAMEIAIRHAVGLGPAIVASLELPRRLIGARIVGIRCDESWAGVVRGRVKREHMLEQWPERLRIIERRDCTIDNLHASIAARRTEYPEQPPLVVVDYVQLLDNDERDIRRRVARAMEDLHGLAEEHRAVVLALSQGSRASSRQLASGEKLGRDTADAGAEAAELERWSTFTIGIGGHGPADEHGWSAVDLSIGKARGDAGGDTVHPARYCGRSGPWRLAGAARPAAEVKAEREKKKTSQRVDVLALAIPNMLDASTKPMARTEIRGESGGRDEDVRAACRTLLEAAAGEPGDVVEVGKRERGAYKLWTRRRADAAGVPIVPRLRLVDAEPGGDAP